MNRSSTTRALALFTILVCFAGAAPAGESADVLGELYRGDPDEAGLRGPIVAGRLLADEILLTGTDYVLIHLENGVVLKLSANSAILARSGGTELVTAQVLSGHAALLGENGRVLRAGAGSTISLGPTSVDPRVAEQRLLDDVASGDAYRGRSARDAERARLRAERR